MSKRRTAGQWKIQRAVLAVAAGMVSAGAGHSVVAADGTWNAAPTNGNWVTSTENNWNNTIGAFPGAVSGTTSPDTATFTGTSSTTAIVINSAGLNVKNITFDGTTPSLYTIGATNGNSITLTAAGAITMASTNTLTGTGRIETIAAPLVLSGSYTFNNANSTSSNLLVVSGGIAGVSGATTLTLSGGNVGTNTISGVIGDGTSSGVGITKTGTGNWVLAGVNTFSGSVQVSAGALTMSSISALGNATTINVSSGGALALAAGGSFSGKNVTLAGNGTSDNFGALKSNGTGTTTWNGNVTLAADGARIGTTASNGASMVVGGVIDSGASSFGPAIRLPNSGNAFVLFNNANTYKGNTQVVVGTLKVGVAGALPSTTTVIMGNSSAQGTAQLDLFGNSASVAGLQTVSGANIGTISVTNSSSNAATLTMNNAGSLTYGGTSGTATILGNLSMVKAGAGIWTIGNSNVTGSAFTYSGSTGISGGTLLLAHADMLPDASPMTLSGNAIFNTGGLNETTGTLTLASSAAIDMGAGASILHYANSSAQAWAGTLTINNWSGDSVNGGGTDQIFFGSDPTGLTAAQLSEISFTGFSAGAHLALNGEVLPGAATPEPTVGLAAMLLGGGFLMGRKRKRVTLR
jgi:autotransporter-associated beta strand protein